MSDKPRRAACGCPIEDDYAMTVDPTGRAIARLAARGELCIWTTDAVNRWHVELIVSHPWASHAVHNPDLTAALADILNQTEPPHVNLTDLTAWKTTRHKVDLHGADLRGADLHGLEPLYKASYQAALHCATNNLRGQADALHTIDGYGDDGRFAAAMGWALAIARLHFGGEAELDFGVETDEDDTPVPRHLMLAVQMIVRAAAEQIDIARELWAAESDLDRQRAALLLLEQAGMVMAKGRAGDVN